MTRIRIADVSNPQLHDFLTRIDFSRGGSRNGEVNSREAADAVRKMGNSASWRADAMNALGTLPTNGAELLSLAGGLGQGTSGVSIRNTNRTSTSNKNDIVIGTNQDRKEVTLTAKGKVAIDGRVYKTAEAYSKACADAAVLAANLDGSDLSAAQLKGLASGLKASVKNSLRSNSKSNKRLFASTMTLLTTLANTTTGRERNAFINTALDGLEAQKNTE